MRVYVETRITPAPRNILPLTTRLLHKVVHLVMNFLDEKIPPGHVLLQTRLAGELLGAQSFGQELRAVLQRRND